MASFDMKRLVFFSLLFFSTLFSASAQSNKVTLSGLVRDAASKRPLPIVNVIVKHARDSSFVTGIISGDDGRYSIANISSGKYLLQYSLVGYMPNAQTVAVGQLTNFLELGPIELKPDTSLLQTVTVTGKQNAVSATMDKKTYTLADNINQAGGTVMEAMKNLPGITVAQDGKLQLRGSDKLVVLIEGKQTALTGFGAQSGLDNIPASAIERIEIINNPSAKYDANGNAGIINIIYKKERKEGFNGRVGMALGAGALWEKKENYPGIRPQYKRTPKINPSVGLNYRNSRMNIFFQADNLYTRTLNKNEFADRYYSNGDTIRQQTKRNRTTNIITAKSGVDWYIDKKNTASISALFSSEKILDLGDEPFFNAALSERKRLWQFLEDELKTTITASAGWQHKFTQPGRLLNASINYTFHREDEKYFFTNILPSYTGLDSFKLISDEHVADISVDYVQPLRNGRFEVGTKFRRRYIPTNMQFKPGVNSPLDTSAGGKATYGETIPALYGTYVFENDRWEWEAGLRVEYVQLEYDVNPYHPVYRSDGYWYVQPFPNTRLAYKINGRSKISVFFNRRVDRPNEVDIRIFPKYDDAEIIKVGNPALSPQFTNSYEMGYRLSLENGFFYAALFHRHTAGTITRIATQAPPSPLIYTVFQNAGNSNNTGSEIIYQQMLSKTFSFNVNATIYQNVISAFTVENKYPVLSVYSAPRERLMAGNIKGNILFKMRGQTEAQLSLVYLSPDLIPQGRVESRFSVDLGIKKQVMKLKGEWYLNASDLFNTFRVKRRITGNGFSLVSTDYYETQVVRVGYNYKFR